MYRKSIRTKRLEAKRKRAVLMCAAKARKRHEQAAALVCVGTIITAGILGNHIIRLMDSDEGILWPEVDGQLRRPRTAKGVLRVLGEICTK